MTTVALSLPGMEVPPYVPPPLPLIGSYARRRLSKAIGEEGLSTG